jgi:hypothetical protein
MVSPIQPEVCLKTGRLLTEWFEFPEYTYEQIEKMACEKYGVAVEDRPMGHAVHLQKTDPEAADLARKINSFIAARKRVAYPNGMSKQEVQYRLNEATKMVSTDNFKFLNDDVRERTGLEINPLWMMECLIRSGTLSPKEQVAALKELAQYTHSKAPSINHTTTTQLNPEDWLLELAKEEYKVIGTDIPMPQPKTPIEKGTHKWFEKNRAARIAEKDALRSFGQDEMSAMEAELADWDEDEVPED